MTRKQQPIYFCTQWMTRAEKMAVAEVMDTDWVTTVGPAQGAFEREFCATLGPNVSGVALSSGTAALELAYRLIGVGAGDIIVCSTFSFIATISPAARMGAVPIFVDSEEDSWNMDPALLDDALAHLKRLGKRAKAVVVTHVYGQSAEIGEIARICERYDTTLIEDAAEAVGTHYRRRHVGTHGLISIFSFNGNKTVTSGGGGMLCSTDAELVKRASHLAFQAREPGSWDYVHQELGYNFRLSNVLAAVGCAQVRRIPEMLKRKQAIHDHYSAWARKRSDVQLLEPPKAFPNRATHWLNILRLKADSARLGRLELRDFLLSRGVQTRPVWYPLHRQPVFRGCQVYSRGIADSFQEEAICLPSGISLTQRELARVVLGLEDALGRVSPARKAGSTPRRKGRS